jgi:copper chaperone CopZ
MSTKKFNTTRVAGAGILTAVAASLCCITPVLALISGAAGAASAFSWMEPFRPYLIGVTIIVLGFAWYQKLKPRRAEDIECDCEEDKKSDFWQSKLFLGMVTVFAVLMMAFPYYSSVFYPDNKKDVVIVQQNNIQTLHLNVAGLTCSACDNHVENAAYQVQGVINAKADFNTGKAVVKFDKSKTSVNKIIKSIDATSYKVTGDSLVH